MKKKNREEVTEGNGDAVTVEREASRVQSYNEAGGVESKEAVDPQVFHHGYPVHQMTE